MTFPPESPASHPTATMPPSHHFPDIVAPAIDPESMTDKLPDTSEDQSSGIELEDVSPEGEQAPSASVEIAPAIEPSETNQSQTPADQINAPPTNQSSSASQNDDGAPGSHMDEAPNSILPGAPSSDSPTDQPIETATNLPLARLNPELEHKRVQLGKYWTCIWCQYKKRTLLKGPERSIKAGRSTSGCETCKVALCLKSGCWEEFHKPTIPPTDEPHPASKLPKRPRELPPGRLNPELEHRRIQLGPRLICLWCQHKLKNPEPEKMKRPGRSTSGCATCEVPLCLKTKCWEKLHQPTEPLMTLPEKRLDTGIAHQRIQFEKMKACTWCQYKIKYLVPQSEKSKRAGRSMSGCSGCEVTLCSKTNCWEEFHRPTKPHMTLPQERLDEKLDHRRVQFGNQFVCFWCQYERKYPQPDKNVKRRAGRTTSGCESCQAPLCLKTKCWEEFHAT